MGPAVIEVKLVTRAVRRGRLVIYVCMLENIWLFVVEIS